MHIEYPSTTAAGRSLVALCLGASLTFAVNAYGDVDTGEVTFVQDASATADRGSYDRRTQEMKYMATLINRTDSDIVGPVYVHVRDISEPGVTDVGYDDVFSDGRGLYLVNADLEPDEQIKKEFTFHNPQKKKFRFVVDMWVDSATNPDIILP